MDIDWDIIISGVILTWLFLVIAAKMTRQKIPELLTGIKDFITGGGEDAIERGEELIYND